ncbi:MAG: phosphate ABC transporter, permease protein PstA, partial [Coriobacteriia bacterium]|nr:phosphate ABC transporter, permease protein PstA [Coriobacteriia bacterium]
MNKRIANTLALGMLWTAALITMVVLFAVISYVFINGIGQISPTFIFTWPHGVNAEGGVWPTIVST